MRVPWIAKRSNQSVIKEINPEYSLEELMQMQRELTHWKRLLRVPWTARRSYQSILKEINSEYSLEELMLKLKLQYFGHLMQTARSLEKTLMLGKIEAEGEGDDRE